MKAYGFHYTSDTTVDASKLLIDKLRSEITDISDIYNVDQLLMIYDAVYGEAEVIPMDQRKERKEKVVVVIEKKSSIDVNRKKVRIDLTTDLSYANPLFEHMARYESFETQEIKTGLAIKHIHGGFKSNIANFNELRTINGELYGNLYFNQIRSDEQYSALGIGKECKWFRGYAQLQKVNIYDVIDYLSEKNLTYLLSLSATSNKRRLTNTKRLLLKA